MRTPPPPPETETKPIKSVASRTPRWARHCSATWHFTVAKITQSDAFNYMLYHFLCKRGIRPARTEHFLVNFIVYQRGRCRTAPPSTPAWQDIGNAHAGETATCVCLGTLLPWRRLYHMVTWSVIIIQHGVYGAVLKHLNNHTKVVLLCFLYFPPIFPCL